MSTENSLLSWVGAKTPDRRVLEGRFVRLEPLSPDRHGDQLWHEFTGPDSDPKLFDWLYYGPFENRDEFDVFIKNGAVRTDPLSYAVVDLVSGNAQGILCFSQIRQAHGTIEAGPVYFGASMQRSVKGTEAAFLLAQEAFALGYRRLECGCNNENSRSKLAALRAGFTFEGVLRQRYVNKGASCDHVIYSILDKEWPALQKALQQWLSPSNFNNNGQQIQTLEKIRENLMNETTEYCEK